MPSPPAVPAPTAPGMIVGIGASAGGLEAIVALLEALPRETGISYVIIQHSAPHKRSLLSAILARSTTIPVVEISDELPIEADRIYVAPPAHDITLTSDAFHLKVRDRRAALDDQLDKFLISLSHYAGRHAIGVVLSGTGSDGTEGLRKIKANGGLTFVESPSSARFPSMPQSAIAAGVVDRVLTPPAIARKLGRLARQGTLVPHFPAPPAVERPPGALQAIFRTLRSAKNVNFADYKPSTLRRRITRRMALRHVHELEAYAQILQKEPQEVQKLFSDLLISVTSFFRDRALFRTLEKTILPRLIAEKQGRGDLRIWVPGCATGQEVYSIAISVVEVLQQMKGGINVQIFGTDLSEAAVTRARAGSFPASTVGDVPADRLRRYFTRKGGSFQVNRSIRDLCTFAQQNLAEDPPFSRLDLVSCRNVLIYFGTSLQQRCIPLFYYALNADGLLVLGGSETIGSFADLFSLMDKKNKIYRKKGSGLPRELLAKRVNPEVPALPRTSAPAVAGRRAAYRNSGRNNSAEIQAAADQLILTHFAPCGVVIDSQLQVWHFRGDTALYLAHGPGTASLNLLKMVRPGLAADLSAAIYQAIKTKEGVRKEGLTMETKEGTREIQIEVIPFSVDDPADPWLLVIFASPNSVIPILHSGKTKASGAEAAYMREISRLRAELRSTKESLQAIIETHEVANEEIKSANEEIESSNEELQSSNEELETAKEELQSTNEELSTVNDELNNRNEEISEINNDLNNLLSSINVAVVLVDHALTIRRTTHLAEKLFNIIPSDIGRKLTDINPNFEFKALPQLIKTVMEDLVPCQSDVQDRSGNWYSLRIKPYRTRENVIDGVILTLVDTHTPNVPARDTLPPGRPLE